jgi:hypothetical protein
MCNSDRERLEGQDEEARLFAGVGAIVRERGWRTFLVPEGMLQR